MNYAIHLGGAEMSVTQGLLPFKLTADTSKSVVTSFSGLPLVVETMRALKLDEARALELELRRNNSGLPAYGF